MKKRLLITSIVMMLVVAVALSTATYAWFTSSTQVTASSISMTAGTSGSSALGIAWATSTPGEGETWNSGYGTTITAKQPAAAGHGFQPAAPAALGNAEPQFYTAFIDSQGEFTADGGTTPVYRFTEDVAQNPSNLIHIANLAASGTTGVNLTATITGASGNDGAALIRIAVFEYDLQSPGYTYLGTLSATPGTRNTAVGDIVEGNAAAALLTGSTTATVSLGTIAGQTEKAFAIYVWLDGALFDEAQGGKVASIALSFSAAA